MFSLFSRRIATATTRGISCALLFALLALLLSAAGRSTAQEIDTTPIRMLNTEALNAAAFHLTSDESLVLTGGPGGASLYDLETGVRVQRFQETDPEALSVAVSPDGALVATGYDTRLFMLWNRSTGEAIRYTDPQGHYVDDIQFSSDGERLLTAGRGPGGRLWSVETGVELLSFDWGQVHRGSVRAGSLSQDGSLLITGSIDDTAALWDARDGRPLRSLSGHSADVLTVALSPDNLLAATASEDASVRIWNASTGEQVGFLGGHRGSVKTVLFSPDGRFLLSGGADGTVRLWDVETGAELRRFQKHQAALARIACSLDGRQICSVDVDGLVCVWASGMDVTPPPDPDAPIRTLIAEFYETILGRSPSAGEADAWQAGYFAAAAALDLDVRFIPREMARLFFFSEEYAARGRSRSEFLNDCYRVFLQREPTADERLAWLLGDWSREEVVTLFTESDEFAARVVEMYPGMEGDATRNFVATMYVGLLDRLPDVDGLAFFAGACEDAWASGGVESVRAKAKTMGRAVLESGEFQSKDPTAATVVVRLYRAYLGRFPSGLETAYWANQLDAGRETAALLAARFADSEEFTARLRTYFVEE